jgi:hypothetical protein
MSTEQPRPTHTTAINAMYRDMIDSDGGFGRKRSLRL